MGAAVSFAQDSIAKAGSKEKRSERTIPVQSSSDFVRERNELLCAPSLQQNSQQLKIDASRGRGCRDSNLNHESLESPFIIHSALSANSTLHTTPVRRSSSSRNHRSGPNSGDSRVYGTRGAIDFLNRRSPMSESASPNENASDDTSAAEVLTQTAMSLGLGNDDLIFNLLYFDNGNIPNFGTMLNTMQQETLALHSENNTPYKLNPANEKAISHLIQESYKQTANSDNECAVCKDDIEDEAEITRIPNCKHYFHTECLSRWIQLVSFTKQYMFKIFVFFVCCYFYEYYRYVCSYFSFSFLKLFH